MIPREVKRTENARYFVFNKELTQKVGKEVYTKIFKEEHYPAFYCGICGKRMDDTFLNYCPFCGAKNETINKKENNIDNNIDNKIENKTTNKQDIPIEWEDTFF